VGTHINYIFITLVKLSLLRITRLNNLLQPKTPICFSNFGITVITNPNKFWPNVIGEESELLHHTWDAQGSNISPQTAYPVFLSPSMQMMGWYLKSGHDHSLPHPFQFFTY
jgi:hypothetical protein